MYLQFICIQCTFHSCTFPFRRNNSYTVQMNYHSLNVLFKKRFPRSFLTERGHTPLTHTHPKRSKKTTKPIPKSLGNKRLDRKNFLFCSSCHLIARRGLLNQQPHPTPRSLPMLTIYIVDYRVDRAVITGVHACLAYSEQQPGDAVQWIFQI